MKAKLKKQMNLAQLIEWALKNGIKNTYYVSKNRYIVTFDKIGFLESATLPLDEIFTVEEEIEITKNTLIPKMVEIYLDNDRDIPYSQIHYNQTINQAINTQECGSKTLTFHKWNDDDTLTLIWRDGKLVD